MPNVMVVHPSFPAKTVLEFIEYAKANVGKVNMASGGNGTSEHVSGELFKMMAGINMVHVPYRGGGLAVSDLLGAQVQVLFGNILTSIEHVRSGKLRALAVTTATRSDVLPEGVAAPKNTPVAIINTLNGAINAGLVDPQMRARLIDLGGTPLAGSPAYFQKLIVDETEKWAKVVRFSGAKPE